MQEERFKAALDALADPAQTTVVLVTRPDKGALAEAARTSGELQRAGLEQPAAGDQRRVPRQRPRPTPVACAIEALGQQALAAMPPVAARAAAATGCRCAPSTWSACPPCARCWPPAPPPPTGTERAGAGAATCPGLDALVDELAAAGHGLIMVMGKGGVGKTTIAAALALGLVQRGKTVHLSTTDPAAHLAGTLAGEVPGLQVDRIDPKAETAALHRQDHGRQGQGPRRGRAGAAAGGPALALHRGGGGLPRLLADRQRGAQRLRRAGHRAHRPLAAADGRDRRLPPADDCASLEPGVRRAGRHAADAAAGPRLYTRVILVTLPETTPVSQAAALQEDLRRARIEPFAWVVNRSLAAAGTVRSGAGRARPGRARADRAGPGRAGAPDGDRALVRHATGRPRRAA